jgi:hypothetical protein
MDTALTPPIQHRWNWLAGLGLVVLFAWQAWLTLSLFSGSDGWENLLDEQPVLSGQHPLHQYHGYLGAQSLLYRGSWCCYDHAFQAGYPKTPIFDSGSRFAELSMLLAGGAFDPAVYKIGMAVLLWCIPLLLVIGARGAGLNWRETWLAAFFAQLVAWGTPARELVECGALEVLMAAVLLLAVLGLLIRYDREPGFFCWLGLLSLGMLGWFAHPLLFSLVVPLALCYYLTAGVRHRAFLWHVGLWGSQLAALAVNGLWLYEGMRHLWMLTPPPPGLEALPHRTFRTVWESSLWGMQADRALAVFLALAGLIGVALFNRDKKERTTGRLFGLVAAALLLLALLTLLGVGWETLGRIGTADLVTPALWFMTIPAARAVASVSRWLNSMPVLPVLRLATLGILLMVVGFFNWGTIQTLLARAWATEPLILGLGHERQELLQRLRENTTSQARILWEDRPGLRDGSRWPALLPILTGRVFIGGLDPDGRIDHSHAGFVHSLLAGEHRPLTQWSDAALSDYCRRYNVGWVVAWSPAVIERLRAWNGGALELCSLKDGGDGFLFKVLDNHCSFAIHGQADVVDANCHRLILVNVVPKDGKVVLSLHYDAGLRATPDRVRIEAEKDYLDRIPLLRLRLDAPVSRLVLTWDEP